MAKLRPLIPPSYGNTIYRPVTANASSSSQSYNPDFDIVQFNKQFEDVQKKFAEVAKEKEDQRLKLLYKEDKPKTIDQLTVAEILINMKDSIFGTLDDLLRYRFTTTTFTIKNRLFYLGLFILLSVITIYILKNVLEEKEESPMGKLSQSFSMMISDFRNVLKESTPT